MTGVGLTLMRSHYLWSFVYKSVATPSLGSSVVNFDHEKGRVLDDMAKFETTCVFEIHYVNALTLSGSKDEIDRCNSDLNFIFLIIIISLMQA